MRPYSQAPTEPHQPQFTNPSPQRIRNEIQDVRVGRHRDKLELIRNSLRPFEQGGDLPGVPGPSIGGISYTNDQPTSPLGYNQQNDGFQYMTSEQRYMVEALTRLGYIEDAALFALRSTRFQSVEAARDYLQRLHSDHANFNVPSTSTIQIGGNTNIPTNAASNGNLHPVYGGSNQKDESGSSRSTSPLQPASVPYSAGYNIPVRPNPTRGITPVTADYHRTHVHLSRAPSYNTDGYVRQPGDRPKPTISIEKSERMVSSRATIPPTAYKPPLEATTSAPVGPSQIMLGSSVGSAPYAAHPVIRTVFSSQPRNNTVNINVRPAPSSDPTARQYRMDVVNVRDGITSSTYGSPGVTGVQNIMVDPDQPRAFVGYEDELRPSTSSTSFERVAHAPLQRTSRPTVVQAGRSEPKVVRCTSPLPESVANLIKEKKYERSVKPCEPRLYCFFMEQHVERLLMQYKERMKRSYQLQREMEAANLPEQMKGKMLEFLQQKESKYNRLRRQKMEVSMFDVIKGIGVGAFGKVSLVKKKDSGQVYAMKSLLKKDVIDKKQAAHVKAERDILAEADSPWIVKLFFSFQDNRCLYFVMEYVPGGDMMQLLINKQIFDEKLAKFYVAELTAAIEYVHSLGFIHRDIKPDNILIDAQGHLKLTDFGLCTGLRWTHDKRYYGPPPGTPGAFAHARENSMVMPDIGNVENSMKVLHIRHQRKRDKAHSLVGTGNYMAPEVIMCIGHTQLCDWWSVGVILYEMVYGRPPFLSEMDNPKETQHKIVNWNRYLDTSPRCNIPRLSEDCIQMIKGLCRDKSDRLGSQGGAQQVMQHPWFKGIDFKNLRNTRAEFIPKVEHAEDTSNFDPIEITETPFETLGKKTPLNPAFYEFTFRHFFDQDGHGCPSLRQTQKRPPLAPVFETGNRHEPQSSSESIVI